MSKYRCIVCQDTGWITWRNQETGGEIGCFCTCKTTGIPAKIIDNRNTMTTQTQDALQVQVAGRHYKDCKIQPVEYIHANNLSFLEGCIVKRISRWRDKDGFEDLEKIKHEVDLLIQLEKANGTTPTQRAVPTVSEER